LTAGRTESSAATALAALADPVGPALQPVAAGVGEGEIADYIPALAAANPDHFGICIAASDGQKRYFPTRKPLSLTFAVNDADATDRYARLYSAHVVDQINALHVPRYGLGLYLEPAQQKQATPAEHKLMDNLGRAGKRLMGFCRTNLFKRLESSGYAFLQSIDRHILRNQIYLYAIENGLDLPLGVLDAGLLDLERVDEDADGLEGEPEDLLDGLVDAVADGVAYSVRFAQQSCGRV
jgi:hypothetical protein